MSLEEIWAAANRLRGSQEKASAAVAVQGKDWQRQIVTVRREIAIGVAELSAAR